MMAKQLNRRQARWSLYLAWFDFLLHHKSRTSMGKPDTLSRQADHGVSTDDNSNITLLAPKLFAAQAFEGLEVAGPKLDILQDICKGVKQPDKEPITKVVQQLHKLATCSVQSAEWSEQDGLLYFRGHIYVPPTLDLR